MDTYDFITQDGQHKMEALYESLGASSYYEYVSDGRVPSKPHDGPAPDPKATGGRPSVELLLEEHKQELMRLIEKGDAKKITEERLVSKAAKASWLLNNKQILSDERYFDVISAAIGDKTDPRNNRRKHLENKIRLLRLQISHLEHKIGRLERMRETCPIYEDDMEAIQAYINRKLENSDPTERIFFKALFTELWRRSSEEIIDFKNELPILIQDEATEILNYLHGS